jgi:hypothetical protein
MNIKEHPYYYEIAFVVEWLYDKGCTCHQVEDMWCDPKVEHLTQEDTISEILAYDQASTVWRIPETDKPQFMYFVLGNEPGVAICDYTVNGYFDEISRITFKAFEGQDISQHTTPEVTQQALTDDVASMIHELTDSEFRDELVREHVEEVIKKYSHLFERLAEND